jgi:hypothetical protein
MIQSYKKKDGTKYEKNMERSVQKLTGSSEE